MKTKKPYFIIIYGPTGVGKTDFSLDFAQTLGQAHVVNADLGQFYTPLTIGTAKPDWQSTPVEHHLFDVINEPVNFSVQEYRRETLAIFDLLWGKNITPLLVGGSGFYIKSLLFPLCGFDDQLKTAHFRDERYQHYSSEDLWKQLYEIDPDRAARVYPQDKYRICCALDIWHATGEKPSKFVPRYNPPASFLMIRLTRSRDDLYNRINQRTAVMIKSGWVDEVKTLMGTPWEQFLYKKKLIGYDDIIAFLKGDRYKNLDELSTAIAQKTRNYAKRQETFWGNLARSVERASRTQCSYTASIRSINLTLSSVDLYIKELSEHVQTYYANNG